jgi:LacI family transcriptional regulator
VILVRPDTPFFERLNAAFIRVATTLDRSVTVQRSFVDESKPQQVAARILATKCDAVILCSQESPAIIDAVASITVSGIPVVTVVSDLPTSPRLAYVGIDHYAAGRTAGFFMARMVRHSGPVLALCHSFRYRGHADRVSGFRDGLSEHEPGPALTEVLFGLDEQSESQQVVADALRRLPNAVGIYNAGGANRAVKQALLGAGLARSAVFIGHELTVHTKPMLEAGVMTLTIDQNPEEQARRAIEVLLRRFGYHDASSPPGEVPFTIYCPENVRSDVERQGLLVSA